MPVPQQTMTDLGEPNIAEQFNSIPLSRRVEDIEQDLSDAGVQWIVSASILLKP